MLNGVPYFIPEEEPVWVTRKGKKIKVSKMTNLHIINTVRCWMGEGLSDVPENYLGGKKKWIDIFTSELLRRNNK